MGGIDIAGVHVPGFVTMLDVTPTLLIAPGDGINGNGNSFSIAPCQYANTPFPISPTKSYGLVDDNPF